MAEMDRQMNKINRGKSLDKVPLWIMGFIVALVIAIVIYGPT